MRKILGVWKNKKDFWKFEDIMAQDFQNYIKEDIILFSIYCCEDKKRNRIIFTPFVAGAIAYGLFYKFYNYLKDIGITDLGLNYDKNEISFPKSELKNFVIVYMLRGLLKGDD
jgi:hypothetical protein